MIVFTLARLSERCMAGGLFKKYIVLCEILKFLKSLIQIYFFNNALQNTFKLRYN